MLSSKQYAASQYSIPNNTAADLFVPNLAFNAMADILFGTDQPDNNGKYHSFTADFQKLCSSDVSPSVKEGCAMLAFEIYGGQNRAISNYYYQVDGYLLSYLFSVNGYFCRVNTAIQHTSVF